MRIESYNQVQKLYDTKKVNKTKQSGSASKTIDQLQISSLGKDFQSAKTAVNSAPDVREDLVASVRERVQNGTYSVDTADFAAKLLQKFEEMR